MARFGCSEQLRTLIYVAARKTFSGGRAKRVELLSQLADTAELVVVALHDGVPERHGFLLEAFGLARTSSGEILRMQLNTRSEQFARREAVAVMRRHRGVDGRG